MASEESVVAGNHSGIPRAIFIEDVEDFMKTGKNDAETVLLKLEENHKKYECMKYNLSVKKSRLKTQLPDIKSTLELVKHMQNRKSNTDDMVTHYQLYDCLYAKARIPPTDKVGLWLGANIMLEYSVDEAESLLDKNYNEAVKSLDNVETDLEFVRDQITTTEVNMARVYNWDVKRRQALKLQAQ